jgi:hypothetical protein
MAPFSCLSISDLGLPERNAVTEIIMGYSAIRYLGEDHIKDCVRACRTAQLALPPAR